MYVEYSYYTGTYCGSAISEEEWPAVEREAAAYIDQLTFGRLKRGEPVTDEVRMAVCAVADVAQRYSLASQGYSAGKASENVDGYSVSYLDPAKMESQEKTDMLRQADIYLPRNNPLRYAGVEWC